MSLIANAQKSKQCILQIALQLRFGLWLNFHWPDVQQEIWKEFMGWEYFYCLADPCASKFYQHGGFLCLFVCLLVCLFFPVKDCGWSSIVLDNSLKVAFWLLDNSRDNLVCKLAAKVANSSFSMFLFMIARAVLLREVLENYSGSISWRQSLQPSSPVLT